MLDMFFEQDSYFLTEGKNMLVDEFGKDNLILPCGVCARYEK